jgi:hypothetical protein
MEGAKKAMTEKKIGPIALTEEDDVEEITRILDQEHAVNIVFREAQRNAEARAAELGRLGNAWWDRFLARHGLERDDEMPRWRLVYSTSGVTAVTATDSKLQITQAELETLLERLRGL